MTFLQPFLLWGSLAVLVPVFIHFWHQKKGKPLAWAATQWLVEKNQQQQRGLKLDNILLMLLRCLLVILLAVLLSQPVLNGLKSKVDIRPIHLIQPASLVTTDFRFELEEAGKRGEKLYWINEGVEPVDKPEQLPEKQVFTPLLLQAAIDKLRQEDTEVHLYLLNNEALTTVPSIYVPAKFRLHTVADSTSKSRTYLATKGDQKLFINQAGKLTSNAVLDPNVRFPSEPVHRGQLKVLLTYRNQREQQTVEAALNALAQVYDLDLLIDRNQAATTNYDWVLTDRAVPNPSPQTLYILSGMMGYPTTPNILYTEHSLTPQTDDRVANGQLPEWLGERLMHYYRLQVHSSPLSPQELKAQFVVSNRVDHKPQTLVHNVLVLLFVVLIGVERWMALTKNA